MLTREELRTRLEPIVLDHHNNREKLSCLLGPIAAEHYGDKDCRTQSEFDELSELWNGVMADIVEEHNLRRH